MRACHWFLRLLLPTPMKRLVRCRLLKRRRGTLARSLFSVAFTCTQAVQCSRALPAILWPSHSPLARATPAVKLSQAPRICSAVFLSVLQSNAQLHLKHHEAVMHLFSGLADELGHRLLVVLLHREVGGDGRVVAS